MDFDRFVRERHGATPHNWPNDEAVPLFLVSMWSLVVVCVVLSRPCLPWQRLHFLPSISGSGVFSVTEFLFPDCLRALWYLKIFYGRTSSARARSIV